MCYVRLVIAVPIAILALGICVNAASANRLSVNETRWTHVWSPLRFIAATNTISCPVTIEGSFHSSVSQKTANALSGFVSRASINNAGCVGGHVTVLSGTIPWHVQYVGFEGALPNITAVRSKLIGAAFSVQPLGSVSCLVRTTVEHPSGAITHINGSHVATEMTIDPTSEIPLTGALGACSFAGSGHLEGVTASLTRLGSTGQISVTLI